MRIDKYLAHALNVGRTDVKKMLKAKRVQVDGQIIKDGKFQVTEQTVRVDNRVITYQENFYYLLHKPQGVVTATKDASQRTVMDLFSAADYRADLYPVGRLDKDTTGLLLITNDGPLGHKLLSPKKHVAKTYLATVAGELTLSGLERLRTGLELKNGEQTQPAQVQVREQDPKNEASLVEITIHEGKYHQVKRMFAAISCRVVELKRLTMGSLSLPADLPPGAYRPLTDLELAQLKG
ncbi:rRNA pseudouridine synthase [Ligilactobacillus equi]|uniref:Pseudouridine synthase n=1 Tax=Ligilactobacillus equi DPC 6820 TaxID=1392007 RepID=V7HWE3_9LACO|nr:pseudouridine synthase [Ligilactobacillus equi]ETA73523.1 rsuA2 protein [Ligilactobacillus equi DPC 6820]